MKYFVHDKRNNKFAEIVSATESGVKCNMSNGGRMTLEMNRGWIARNTDFYKAVDFEEVIKKVGNNDKPPIDDKNISTLNYRDVQAVAKSKGINPFGKTKEVLLKEIKAKK